MTALVTSRCSGVDPFSLISRVATYILGPMTGMSTIYSSTKPVKTYLDPA